MFAKHPKIAEKFAHETKDMRSLPEHVKKGKKMKKRLMLHAKVARGMHPRS